MLAFASVIGSEEKFRRYALPGLERAMEPDSVLAQFTDATSMCGAYNEILDAFSGRDDLEALVLLHEDTEIQDPDFCAKVRARFADDEVAVIGVAGAKDVRTLRWWEGSTRGRVTETRGHLDFGGHRDDVDAVDGLLVILSPWAVRNLRFDAETFDGFHAYDVDICFQARAAGKRVVVEDIPVFHHTKGGYGDEGAYARAAAAFQAKWFPPPPDEEILAANREALATLEAACESLAAQERWEDAAAVAQSAAHLAWMNHPGVFASARLDAVLAQIARTLPGVAAERLGADGRERVLHVLTEGYDTGGHTRLAWRWMQQDGARDHSAVLTRQWTALPPQLATAVEDAGGRLTVLPPAAPILGRAAALRELASGFDRVVLHAHPDDPVPPIALGVADRPPTILCNHADHAFWLGRPVADAVVSPRAVGSTIAVERRGLPAERCSVLEVPLGGARTAAADRGTARARLGLSDDTVVLLTIGAAYKYEPVGEHHLLDAVEPVLARHPNALLLAVGPDEGPRWRQARERTGGRVLALGHQSSIGDYHAAADVYLESYPCSSVTAVAEAVVHEVPVLAFAPDPDQAEVWGSTPVPAWRRAETVEAYGRLLDELIADPEARGRWGAAAAEVVMAARDASIWRAQLEEVYDRSARLAPAGDELAVPAEGPGRHDLPVLRAHLNGGMAVAPSVVVRRVAQLELAARTPAARALFGSLTDRFGAPELQRRCATALAAPTLEPDAIGAAVDALRVVARAGVAERLVLTVAPADVDDAVPLVEAALARGDDIDIDLVPAASPELAAPGALRVDAPVAAGVTSR